MPKNNSITLNTMDYRSGIDVGIWDRSTPGIIKALEPHRHDHYTCMLIEAGKLEVVFDFNHLEMSGGYIFCFSSWTGPSDSEHFWCYRLLCVF